MHTLCTGSNEFYHKLISHVENSTLFLHQEQITTILHIFFHSTRYLILLGGQKQDRMRSFPNTAIMQTQV